MVVSGLHMANIRPCRRKQPSCGSRQQCDSQQVWYRSEQCESAVGSGGLALATALDVASSVPALLAASLPAAWSVPIALSMLAAMLLLLSTLGFWPGGGAGGFGAGLDRTSQSHVPSLGHTSRHDA